jgi:multidrug efflux system outer membrane protein
MKKLASPLVCALLITGCAVGPDYTRPELTQPANWRSGSALPVSENSSDLANLAWWTLIEDPVLDALVAEALANNRDLKIAAARIDEAAGVLGTTRAQLFPQIGADLNGNRAQSSDRGLTPRPATVNHINEQYSAAFNVGWEIDLFGRLRRATEASRADLLATEEARSGLALSLATTVANSYISLRDLDAELDIARLTLQTREESLRIFELRYKGGVVSEMEVAQVRSEYEAARIAVPTAELAVAQQENAISVLLGRLPGPIPRGKALAEMGLPLPPVSLPSAVLERRPDIRQSEQNLIANNARIGVAKAAYFPSVTLTGLLGSSSVSFSNLFSGPARVWSYGADVAMPIFTAGSIFGQVKSAEARQAQALEQYRKTIENAFREVDDALISGIKSREIVDGRIRQVDSLKIYAKNARLRYDAGYSSFLEVLDAERSLFQSQIYESQARAQALIAVTTLYKTLGGGWEASIAPPSPPATETADIKTKETE